MTCRICRICRRGISRSSSKIDSARSQRDVRRAPCDVTVTIATRNRADALRTTLDSLRRQKLGELSWQVIVVDNGSSDDTADVLASAGQHLPLITLFEPSPGKNRALNAALDAATGDLLVFTDDDIVADPAWLQRLSAAATRWPDINIFGGLITPAFPADTPDWLRDPEFPHARWTWGTYAPRQDEGPTRETPLGPNLAFRRAVLDGVQWDESIGPQGTSFAMDSEVELLMRLARRGELFVFVPDARVKHVLRSEQVSESYLEGRAFRCGRGNAPGAFPVNGQAIFPSPFSTLPEGRQAGLPPLVEILF